MEPPDRFYDSAAAVAYRVRTGAQAGDWTEAEALLSFTPMQAAPTLDARDGSGLVLPDEIPADHSTLPRLWSRYLAATLRGLLTARPAIERRLAPDERVVFRRAVAALLAACASDRPAALACLGSPGVATAIHCLPLRDELPGHAARIDEAVARIGTTLLRQLGPSVDAPGDPARDRDPRFLPVGPTTLALQDDNPIATFEAHPDKAGNAIDLGGEPVAVWQRALGDALALVRDHLPLLHDELALLLRRIVPVGYHRERHLSASYREAIGTVYLTLHPDPLTLAEALVHELQHNKLNLASYSMRFLDNAFAPLYPSPVRPDPRPLWGILLAVHAFLPVAALYRRLRAAGHPRSRVSDFEQRLETIDRRNREGMEMLARHAVFTPAGQALGAELEVLSLRHGEERGAGWATSSSVDAHD